MQAVLNPFEPGPAAGLALFATRLGGLVLVAPVFSARTIPAAVKTAVVVILTITLAPALLAQTGPAPVVGAQTLVSELLIGISLGIGAAVFIGAAEVAGDVISLQTGLSGAGSLDPLTQLQSQTLADFLKMLVTTLWLAIGGHLITLEALADSATLLPPGDPVAGSNGLFALLQLGTLLFAMGLQIAAPIVAAVFVGQVAMGVLARTAPQLQVFMLAYPLQIAIGVLVLAFTLPFVGVTVGGWPEQYRSVVSNLLDALAR